MSIYVRFSWRQTEKEVKRCKMVIKIGNVYVTCHIMGLGPRYFPDGVFCFHPFFLHNPQTPDPASPPGEISLKPFKQRWIYINYLNEGEMLRDAVIGNKNISGFSSIDH